MLGHHPLEGHPAQVNTLYLLVISKETVQLQPLAVRKRAEAVGLLHILGAAFVPSDLRVVIHDVRVAEGYTAPGNKSTYLS